MAERRSRLSRSLAEANRVSQLGMLRGAVVGVVLTLPLGTLVGAVGTFLDSGREDSLALGCLLALTVEVVGAFVGTFWVGQSSVMRDWPVACRQRVWHEWRREIALFALLGFPVAVLLGWYAWQAEGSWSLSTAIVVLVCGWFALTGAGVGYWRGEKSVRQFLQQEGYGRFDWLRYGEAGEAPSADLQVRRREQPGSNPDLKKPGQLRPK